MKKLVLGTLILASVVVSGCSSDKDAKKPTKEAATATVEAEEVEVDGYAVYQKYCQSCHVELMTAKEAMANLKTLKAPPMVEVSARIKEMIVYKGGDEDTERELRLTFIRDYIKRPDIEKSMCHLGAIDRFDVMPSLKGIITEAELHAVAEWVYDRYEGVEFK